MPIYEYKCKNCGEISEFLIHGHEGEQKLTCSSCGSVDLEKKLSVPAMVRTEHSSGGTCCGRENRCDTPPCSSGGRCCH
jgi:putative FmdB family regulatory protein